MKLFGVPLSLLLAPSASASASDAVPEWIDGDAAPEWIEYEMRRLDAADFVDTSMSVDVVGIAKRGSGPSRSSKSKAAKSTKGSKGGTSKSGKAGQFPTLDPTSAPTPKAGQCAIDTSVNCTTVFDNDQIGCEDITQEQQLGCFCPVCAREVQFKYTQGACTTNSKTGQCTDHGPNPSVAAYKATDCGSGVALALATGTVRQGRSIVITAPGSQGGCLPDRICVTISLPSGPITQTLKIHSKCNGGNNLILLENYGAFESIGYSCSETDTHNCIQSVSYGLNVCNIGSTEETIDEWDLTIKNLLTFKEEEIDLLEDIPPEDVSLAPGDCFYDTYETAANRCEASEIFVGVFANATNPSIVDGTLCEDSDELKYAWSLPPTLDPTSSPTPKAGQCAIDTSVNCTTVLDNEQIGCEDIPQEQQLGCDCPECAREVQFMYTGLACNSAQNASGECTDFTDNGPNPLNAVFKATVCDDPAGTVLATGEVNQQDQSIIVISGPGSQGGCLPDVICVTISLPSGSPITQSFKIESKCDGGNELILLENYGAFESIGYSCSETNTHNCIQSVSYGLDVCNIGSTEETIEEWDLTINGEEIDLLKDIPPEDVSLDPGDCYYDTYETAVNRCEASEICVDVFANATNPSIVEGTLCEDGDELKYGWNVSPTLDPTSAPTPTPTPSFRTSVIYAASCESKTPGVCDNSNGTISSELNAAFKDVLCNAGFEIGFSCPGNIPLEFQVTVKQLSSVTDSEIRQRQEDPVEYEIEPIYTANSKAITEEAANIGTEAVADGTISDEVRNSIDADLQWHWVRLEFPQKIPLVVPPFSVGNS